MANISDLIRSSVRRDPSVQPITRSPSQMQAVTSQLGQAAPTVRTQPGITRGATASSYVSQLLQTSVRREPSVQPIARSASQMQTVTRQLGQRTVSRELPTSRGATASSYVSQLAQSSISRVPAGSSRGMGGAMPPLPTGRSVVSPVVGDRTGVLPSSTLATQGAFGGESGGMGAAAAAPASGAVDLGLGGIGESVSSFGSGIVDTVKEYIPLAIKVILVVIVFKIVLWLLRGRR